MKSINLITLRGGYYDNGLALALQLRESEPFQQMLKRLKRMWTFKQDPQEIKTVLTNFCPQLIEELKGIQDGLQLSEEETLRLFAGYDMPQLEEMGCTSFICSDYYVRNYDFSPDLYDHTFLIQTNLNGRSLVGNTQFVLGRLDGMNSNGLVVGLHFVSNESYTKGFLCSTIVRIILEMCDSVSEAIARLKRIPHAACYNYSLLDRHGNFAIFEASPHNYTVYQESSSITCVNLFQTEKMKGYNRPNHMSSVSRLQAIADFSNRKKSVDSMHQWFSDRTSPVFFTDYHDYFGTLHTVSYLPKSERILLTDEEKTWHLTIP